VSPSHRLLRLSAALLSTAALGATALVNTSADAQPQVHARATIPITVVSVNDAYHVTLPATLTPGLRRIKVVTTTGHAREADFVHLKPGYTLDDLVSDLNASFSTDTPDLEALNRFYDSTVVAGGLVARQNVPGLGRLTFFPGQWYAFDPAVFPTTAEAFTPFMVAGEPTGATTTFTARITAEHDTQWNPRPVSINYRGWIKFTNKAESPHFIELAKLAPGKTYADFKAWVKAVMSGHDAPPPFGKFSLDEGLVSPGHAYTFKYDIPKGNYVVLCFMPDRETGLPHAFMGMSRPLTVK
jgi:hypothetical protein